MESTPHATKKNGYQEIPFLQCEGDFSRMLNSHAGMLIDRSINLSLKPPPSFAPLVWYSQMYLLSNDLYVPSIGTLADVIKFFGLPTPRIQFHCTNQSSY